MPKASITVKTDDDTKVQAAEIFRNMGMDMSTGINVFLRSVVQNGKLPFTPSSEPSSEYRAWMKKELAKSYDLAQDPQTPRIRHEDFWAEFEGAQ